MAFALHPCPNPHEITASSSWGLVMVDLRCRNMQVLCRYHEVTVIPICARNTIRAAITPLALGRFEVIAEMITPGLRHSGMSEVRAEMITSGMRTTIQLPSAHIT